MGTVGKSGLSPGAATSVFRRFKSDRYLDLCWLWRKGDIMGFIYKITNDINNKIYVGKTE